ncbi:MAG: glucosidase [Litorilinea sp.]|nr:MAG: glucosidase [Litorilinea sp.]
MKPMSNTAEHQRLLAHRERRANWRNWGPYLSERAWGTVREDYSPDGEAWTYFPHDHARSRAYRWNEDGLAGISDRNQWLCFALALWNGRDPILKERLFGLTNAEGNHGEDVKEYYFYLDNTPTHSYMQMLYKYPQAAFPYAELVAENARRGLDDFEYELLDTGVFAENRYFDIFVEYAKADENDILIRITAHNRGPEAATLHLLPTLWFRNTWSWGYPRGPMDNTPQRPRLHLVGRSQSVARVRADHPEAGVYWLYAEDADQLLFTENETNRERLFESPNPCPYVKDAFHRYLVEGDLAAVNPENVGTKGAALYSREIGPGKAVQLRLRLAPAELSHPLDGFDPIFARRQEEADAFYAAIHPPELDEEERRIQRQAFAGLLWTKQLYYYDVLQWLQGDPGMPPPPASRWQGRNNGWEHLTNFDVISMPDKWEYPWYATWDLAFHCLPLALIDPDYAKRQLTLMTREWYMHPNGALPAYEWDFDHANPPVHAWAALQVYRIDAQQNGEPDRAFLEGIFHKLLLNFTWWVNRKDADGRNVFQGGFLGLDNISLFDRSTVHPLGGHVDQADSTAWMGFFSLQMMQIALELAQENPVYQDTAVKFFEHFLRIATAMNHLGGRGVSLWDDTDGFYYDALHLPDDSVRPLRVRSLVGLMPLIAVATLEPNLMSRMPTFARRANWFLQHRAQFAQTTACIRAPEGHHCLMALMTEDRLRRVLGYMLDEDEFLSPYGIRSLSKVHQRPYTLDLGGQHFTIAYEPAESRSRLFGGNSNWRGPVWFPLNILLIRALQEYDRYFGDGFTVEYPTGSGRKTTLDVVAGDLARRLISLFLQDDQGHRPIYGGQQIFQEDPHWKDSILFYEYFHGDNGAGLGASHQTGWTGLVAALIQDHR